MSASSTLALYAMCVSEIELDVGMRDTKMLSALCWLHISPRKGNVIRSRADFWCTTGGDGSHDGDSGGVACTFGILRIYSI